MGSDGGGSQYSSTTQAYHPHRRPTPITNHQQSLLRRASGFPEWNKVPIPGFQIGSGGLLALADLSTTAQRTSLTGGTSWIDALLLAPGLHYQQAADALADETRKFDAIEQLPGKTVKYVITNPATIRYLQRVGQAGGTVTVDVGRIPERDYFRRRRLNQRHGQRSIIWQNSGADLGWVSHLLYLMSPVLTIISIAFLVLLQECKKRNPSDEASSQHHSYYPRRV